MGYIYKIVNDVNNKVYIGQTINTIEERFKEHLWCASNEFYKSKIYRAIREIGKEHFSICKILECDNKELNKWEQYYVQHYDSLNKGYNSVYPISTNHVDVAREIDDKIIELYLNMVAVTDIAIQLNTSIESVNRATAAYERRGGVRRDKVVISNNEKVAIVMYDIAFNPQKVFETKLEAYKYCVENEGACESNFAFYSYTKVACQTGNITFGHRWQLLCEIVHDNKIFRSKFDKEAYIEGKQAYQPDGQNYWVVDGALEEKVKTFKENHTCIDCGEVITGRKVRCERCADKIKQLNKEYNNKDVNKCIDCGKEIGYRALRCAECELKRRNENIPDVNTLNQLISKHSYEEIGRMYGVTGKAVRKWCDKYNLHITKQKHMSNGCYCIINNSKLEFNTFKDAALWLINYLGEDLTLKNVQYSISQACKSGKKYKNITWYNK